MRFGLNLCFGLAAAASCLVAIPDLIEDAAPVGVSFQLAGGTNPLVVVPVYVNGKGPYQFILDTGAFDCLISPELSSAIGIHPESPQRATGAGGYIRLSLARVSQLAVGSTQQENVEVAVTGEVSRFGAAIQTKVDGALGFNFLRNFRLFLDFQHNLLRLSNPSSEKRDGGVVLAPGSIPFQFASPRKPLIVVPVFVNGRGPFQFAVDTGASRTYLDPLLANELGIVAITDQPGTGGGGQVSILSGTAASLRVGMVSVRNLSVGVGSFLGLMSEAADTNLDGVLGDNFLSQFEVTIDYPHRILDLTPLAVR